MLFLDSKLAVKEISYYLNIPKRTVYKWIEAEQWGKEVDVSVDSSLQNTRVNVGYLSNFLKKKAYDDDFDEHYINLTGALKRLADVQEKLLDDAPFSNEKAQIEGTELFKTWLDIQDIPIDDMSILTKYIDRFYQESLGNEAKTTTLERRKTKRTSPL